MFSHLDPTLKQLVTFTVSHFAFFLNFAQLAHMAKFKIEPRYAAVTVTLLTEVALVSQSLVQNIKYKQMNRLVSISIVR